MITQAAQQAAQLATQNLDLLKWVLGGIGTAVAAIVTLAISFHRHSINEAKKSTQAQVEQNNKLSEIHTFMEQTLPLQFQAAQNKVVNDVSEKMGRRFERSDSARRRLRKRVEARIGSAEQRIDVLEAAYEEHNRRFPSWPGPIAQAD